ncbi:MAG: glycosyltransferase [Acidobacteriota bacterium]|nr:glycosyltransferase [Acidobacteriota bacterium]
MKIAFIVGHFPALSETFILNQITGLIDRGHEVDVYAEKSREEPETHPDVEKYGILSRTHYELMPAGAFARALQSPGVLLSDSRHAPAMFVRSLNVFRYGMQAGSLRLFYAARPFSLTRVYDVIHCHFGANGLKGALLRDIGAIRGKLVTAFHGVDIVTDPQLFGRRIYKLLFTMGDLFLPISDRWNPLLLELGCRAEKILVHRMGVDCRRFSFKPRRARTDGRVRIVTVARLVEKKGIEDGIRAVVKLAREGHQNVEYHIVGDGPLREQLRRVIQELNAADTIKLLGAKRQPEVHEILNDADIFLAPSFTGADGDIEGIPVSIMEAMATGLPAVSTRHAGIPELIQDGVSGFLVPERDVDALAERLGYLLKNPHLRPEMGWKGHVDVSQHYNIDELNDTLVGIYQRLMS